MRAKAIKCILALAILVHYVTPAFSQGPQGFSYQAIIRNSDGSALSNQNVLIRLSLTNETGATTYYTEVHTLSTSPLGIVNLIVGKGSTSDNFSTIPWSNGNVWLKVEVDKTQTSGYTLMGSTQLYSVPYAFYSLNGTPGEVGPKGDKGDTGDTGNGISSISANGDGTLTFNFTNGTTYTTFDLTGPQGVQGIQGEIGPQGIQGIKGDKGDQGAPGTGLNNKGNWVSGTTYGPGDYVFAENTGQTANSMWIVKAAAPFSSTTQPRLDLGNWVEFEAPAGPQGPQGPVGPLVSGTAGQTLRHDGTSWVANSFLYNDGSNIGIGTTSPLYNLDINSASNNGIRFGGSSGYNCFRLRSDNRTYQISVGGSASGGYNGAYYVFDETASTARLFLNQNGNLGIGTTSPGAKLDVLQLGGGSGTNIALGLRAGNTGTYYGNNQIVLGYDQTLNYAHSIKTRHNSGAGTMNAIDFYTWKYGDAATTIGGQHTMTLENGNVGIGTTSPLTKLHINTSGTPRAFRISGTASTDYTEAQFAGNGREYRFGVGGSAVTDGSANKFYLYDYNASTFRMMVDPSGNVGIGTTSPSYKLDVAGRSRFQTGNGSAGIWFMNAANTADRSFFGMYDDNLAGIYGIGAGWGLLMNLNNGNVGIGTTTPGAKLDVVGNFRSSGEIISTYPNQARFVYGNYGLIHRNDGSTYYMLLTNSGDPYGSWNGLRPFYIENSTGNVGLGAAALYVQHGGNVGVGTTTPPGKLTVKASSTSTDNDILFSVQDKLGNNVFIVYPDAVQVIVPTDTKSNQRGAFVVSGRGTTKVETNFVNLKKQNYFIGHNVAPGITTGTGNAIMGYEAGNLLTSGTNNIFLGFNAGKANDTGGNNAFVGNNSGFANKGGSNNVFLGNQAGYANTTGSENIFIGTNAGQKNTTGYSNVFIGPTSGNNNTTGYNNTFVGDNAGSSLIGYGNICLGYNSGPPSSTSASNRLYIDNGSGTEASSFIYGDMTLTSKKLRFNTPVGIYTTPGTNHALKVNGYAYISGGNLGVNVDPTVNYGLQVNGGSSTSYSIYAYKGGYTTGSWTSGSDIRLKKDIEPLVNTLEAIKSIKPVYYFWRYDEFKNRELSQRKQIGLIAQEIETVFPELVSQDEEGYKAISYDKFAAVLLSAIQEQQKIIKNQQVDFQSLKNEMEAFKEQQKQLNEKDKEIDALKARLDAIEKILKLNAK